MPRSAMVWNGRAGSAEPASAAAPATAPAHSETAIGEVEMPMTTENCELRALP